MVAIAPGAGTAQFDDRTPKGARIASNRRARRDAERAREQERQKLGVSRRQRQDWQRRVVAAMLRRFFDGGAPYLVCTDYRYWQARKCDWNPIADEYARDNRGNPLERGADGLLIDPESGATWQWWVNVHPKCRMELVKLSGFRLIRGGRG